MSDNTVVEVLPRIGAENLPQAAQPVVATQPSADMVGGLFTSLYDNKILALLLVIVILAIGALAYFVYSKKDGGFFSDSDDAKTVKKGGTAPSNDQQLPAQTQTQSPQTPTQQTQTPAQCPQAQTNQTTQNPVPAQTPQPQTQTPVSNNKKALTGLLERARAATPVKPVAKPVSNFKSDDEIMALMRDSDDTDDELEPAEETATEPATEQPAEPAVVNTPISTQAKPTTCSIIIPPGRPCKLPPKANGKCTRHGGI